MAEQENTTVGDVLAWGLSHPEAAHYHARISLYYALRARQFADLAAGYAAKSTRLAWVAAGLATVAMAISAVEHLLSGGAS